MRTLVCATVAAAVLVVQPAPAQPHRSGAAFWKAVRATCDAAAAKPATAIGRRIAQVAIAEYAQFGGHSIDADGRLFRFGLTEAEHGGETGGRPARLGDLGWWQVMKYWRAVYDDPADKLEVRGFRDASTSRNATQSAAAIPSDAQRLLRAADSVSDPEAREVLREAALRAAAIDTPWSAAFVSYVIRHAGVGAGAFAFANAHRIYIYEAFATSAAERDGAAGERLYRACPLSTRPRVGDLICQQREPALADADDAAVRERIRTELAGSTALRSVRRTHCEVVAHVDVPARKMYTIGGNVNQSVTARKLNLREDLRLSTAHRNHCGGPSHWTLPSPADSEARPAGPAAACSLNERNWFVLLQVR
jgi:hypothetical protein